MKCKHLKEWDVNWRGVHCKECKIPVTSTFINELLHEIKILEIKSKLYEDNIRASFPYQSFKQGE